MCIALVEPLPPTPADQQAAAQAGGIAGAMPPPAVDAAAAEVHAAMREQATQCIARSIDRLVALLEPVDGGRQLPTSYGLLQPPVGLPRLKAVELLAALLHNGAEAAGGVAARGAGWLAAQRQGGVPGTASGGIKQMAAGAAVGLGAAGWGCMPSRHSAGGPCRLRAAACCSSPSQPCPSAPLAVQRAL